ncbi:MAG TPA: hypothetical protein VGQ71_01215 [Terriglobales bacterium]|nr:hypothetical protein [Terriglobales bacterium]
MLPVLLIASLVGMGFAQSSGQSTSLLQDPPADEKEEDGPIQDNSFLLEEAYNQEYGVVQHISGFQRLWESKQWAYNFTQEWPVNPRPRHQLSFTIPFLSAGDSLGGGIGDIALNYRYQLVGDGKARVAFAPRFSLLLPTGNHRLGRGSGAVGLQGNLPLSVTVSKKLVTHWNLGTTIVPNAKGVPGEEATTHGYNLGQSFIWLAHSRFNVMFETVWNGSEAVAGQGQTARGHSLFINPGIRWAHDLSSGLQIVPGIAVPIGIGPSSGEKGIFFYLSFEHPFKKVK